MAVFCERLGDMIAEKGLTVKELSRLSDIHPHTIYMLLNLDTYGGKSVSHPRADTLLRLADALDVSMDYLYGRTDKR